MKQLDVYDYVMLKEHNCSLYKTKSKDDGTHYWVRSNSDRRKIAIIYPTKEDRAYTCGSVCNICNNLGIPVPEYAQDMQGTIDRAKAEADKLDWSNSSEKK